MIRIATAECFTHGKIAREIHAFSQGYPLSYKWTISPKDYRLSLIAGLFIPTISGIRRILKFEPLPPTEVVDDIKVYDESADKKMAKRMAEAIKDITRADIGIGTTAGVGRGGIAIIADNMKVISSSDVYADLRSSPATEIMKRQKSGVERALKLLEDILPHI